MALWNERTGRTVVVAVTMHLLAPAAFDVMQRLIDGGLAATLRR